MSSHPIRPRASRLGLALLIVLHAGACEGPPNAPKTLDDLCGFFFEHLPDEDSDALAVGLDNLRTWLDTHMAETNEGYSVTNLSASAAQLADGRVGPLDGLLGIAVGYDIPYSVDDVVFALVVNNGNALFPDRFESYERTALSDVECFAQHDCERYSAAVSSVGRFTLGLTIDASTLIEYRWVETDFGPALVQRSWLTRPVKLSFDWLDVDRQYYTAINLPTGSGTRRVEAAWVLASITGALPEGTIKSLAVSSLKDTGEAVTEFLDREVPERRFVAGPGAEQ